MSARPLAPTACRVRGDCDAGPAAARSRATAIPSDRRDDLVINGRFYGQPVTGVQRYGRAIVAALDPLLTAAKRRARLAMPVGQAGAPLFDAIRPRRLAPLGGHAWEQAILPMLARHRLLNLCNTAPAGKTRQVVCLHDTHVFDRPDSYRWHFRALYGALIPQLARRAAFVTTVSRHSASAIAQRFGLPVGRIAVLPNGHEHALAWKPHRSTLRPDDFRRRPFVLVLGSRARHKNVGLVLDLAPALEAMGLDLVVAGGSGRIFAGLDTRPAGPNLRWLETPSDDDLAFLLGEALCLAFPSWTEGFGLPIVEAMALGCPVVSSDRASLPEVCGDAALLASPAAPAQWLAHIGALAASSGLRDELRGRGRAQVRQFSWTASAQGYFDLLERLA